MENMVISSNYWKNKKVFITGHTGFKGSWLSLWLQHLGADICGFSLASPTEPNLFTLAKVKENMQSITGDIRDDASIKDAIVNFKPEVVFHLAAQSLVRRSYIDPVGTYETNVIGTINVLEAIRAQNSVASVIVVTSDKCYENKETGKSFEEEDAMGGGDPYSSSKGCAELVTSSYKHSFFNNENRKIGIASVRSGNVIGGGDWAENRLIPDLCTSFIKGEQASIRYPDSIRPWQHVLDPISGYLLLAEKINKDSSMSGGWNFGPVEEDAKPVKWIADELVRLWGCNAGWQRDENKHPNESGVLRLNCNKARKQLGWQSRLSLSQALKLTVEWFKAYENNDELKAVTLNQIKHFNSLESLDA